MIATRSPLLVFVLLLGALLAGCGSSSSTTSSSTAASTPVTTSTSSPVAAGTSSTTQATTSPATTSSAASAAGVAQYVAVCKSIIQREPALAASVKAKVEGICNKAADGDIEGARAAAKEVCVEVINASPIPPGTAKEHALAACKTS